MIIFLTGMPGSGKSTIVQNLIPRLTGGEELSAKDLLLALRKKVYKTLQKPIFVTTRTIAERQECLNMLSNFTGLRDTAYCVHVHASPEACEWRKPDSLQGEYEIVGDPLRCSELILDTMKSSAESNAGFLGLFVMSRKM